MKVLNSKKGITLIALVITIIVLLILAGVSISTIVGDNGILNQAQVAKSQTRIGDVSESADIIKASYQTENGGKFPTSRYTLEKLVENNKITTDEIVDYGDYSGVGLIKIEGVYVYIVGMVYGNALGYELEMHTGYTTIRFYPKLEGSDTYYDYASNIVYGKTDDELKAILVDGWNWKVEEGESSWITQSAETYEEIVEFMYSQEYISEKFESIDDLASDLNWSCAQNMICGWGCVEPDGYDWDKEEVSQNFSIYDEKNSLYVASSKSTESTYITNYNVVESGEYTFVFSNDTTGDTLNITLNIEVEGEIDIADAIITDGNGTILGIKDEYYALSGIDYCQNTYLFSALEIPEKIGDEVITTIGYGAFTGYGLKSIKMPNTITTIEYYAMSSCFDLETIDFSENITYIGEFAFSSTVWNSNLEEGEQYIGNVFYSYVGALPDNSSITIKEGTTGIAGYALSNKSGLVSISLPDSLVYVGAGAFSNCTNLASITLPSNLEYIERNAFNGCTGLTEAIFEGNGVKLAYASFYSCTQLKNVEIAGAFSSVGQSVFYKCTSLEGDFTVNGNIDFYSFGYCSSLKSIKIGKDCTSISQYAFYNCTSLADVYYEGSEEEWSAISIVSNGNTNLTNATKTYDYSE